MIRNALLQFQSETTVTILVDASFVFPEQGTARICHSLHEFVIQSKNPVSVTLLYVTYFSALFFFLPDSFDTIAGDPISYFFPLARRQIRGPSSTPLLPKLASEPVLQFT